jgi:hypothetical protein
MNNKRIFISSLATVVAAGTISMNVSYAHAAKNSGTKRDAHRGIVRDVDFGNFHVRGNDDEALFSVIERAHQLRKAGKLATAKHSLENAGIEFPQNMQKSIPKKRSSVRHAIENHDWGNFHSIMKGKKIGRHINTKEKFDLFVEAKELHKHGRHFEAHQIMKDLKMETIA